MRRGPAYLACTLQRIRVADREEGSRPEIWEGRKQRV